MRIHISQAVVRDSTNNPDSSSNKTNNSSKYIGPTSKELKITDEQNIVSISVLGLDLLLSPLGGLFFKKRNSNNK